MSRKPKDQRFGGWWTAQKLDAVERYLDAYTLALKKQKFQTIYVDAFAGNGDCKIGTEEFNIELDGSAKRALAIKHKFDQYVFIDTDANKINKLKEFCETKYPDLKVRTVNDDANTVLNKLCASNYMNKRRGVVFLDPFGASVTWETLEHISKTKHFDVWYLFPLSAVIRFAANNRDKVLEDPLNSVLGTTDWQKWYEPKSETSNEDYNQKSTYAILNLFKKQMEKFFPMVLDPVILKNNNNSPMFALYFACANDSPSAQKAAKRIANFILDMFEKNLLAMEIKPAIEKLRFQEKIKNQINKKSLKGILDLFD